MDESGFAKSLLHPSCRLLFSQLESVYKVSIPGPQPLILRYLTMSGSPIAGSKRERI
jgi:hypothetical protein